MENQCLRIVCALPSGRLIYEGGASRSVKGYTTGLAVLTQPNRQEASQHVDVAPTKDCFLRPPQTSVDGQDDQRMALGREGF
jgi:hypothetical protein